MITFHIRATVRCGLFGTEVIDTKNIEAADRVDATRQYFNQHIPDTYGPKAQVPTWTITEVDYEALS